MKIRYALMALTLVSLLGVSSSACGDDSSDAGADTVKIGANVPLTGGCGAFGNDYLAAIELARDEINATGGVLGKAIELLVADSQTDGADASANIERFVADSAAAAMGPICSGTASGIPNTVKAQGILTITNASAPSVRDTDDGGFLFRHFPTDDLQGAAIAKYAIAQSWNEAVVLYDDESYGTGLHEQFKAAYTGTLEEEIPYDADAASFADEAQTAYDASPEIVFIFGYADHAAQILTELAARGYDGYAFGGDATQAESLFKNATGFDMTSKWFGTTAGVYKFAPYDDYVARYKSANAGAEPVMWMAGIYDAMMATALAIEAAGSTDDRTAIRDKLREVTAGGAKVTAVTIADGLSRAATEDVDYDGVFSKAFEYDAKGDLTLDSSSYVLWGFDSSGKIVTIEAL